MHTENEASGRADTRERVTVTVDGRTVEGVFLHRSPSDFEIEIQPPFPPLHAGLHIPVYARREADFTTALGEIAAKKTLLTLYRIGEALEARREPLIQAFAELQTQIESLSGAETYTEATYKARRRVLRRQLRSGQHDQPKHQRLMGEIRKRREAHRLLEWDLTERFFDQMIPEAESIDLREQVLDLLGTWHRERGGSGDEG